MLMIADAYVPAADGSDWERVAPTAAGFDPAKLEAAVAFARANAGHFNQSHASAASSRRQSQSALPVPGPSVSLIREPKDKCQGSTEPGHILVVETPDLLSDPFASNGDRLIGHHLRCEPQSILGPGIDRDTKIRSIHQLGSQLADHH